MNRDMTIVTSLVPVSWVIDLDGNTAVHLAKLL